LKLRTRRFCVGYNALCLSSRSAGVSTLGLGRSWRCDETYIRVKGRWTYLYRAVDKLDRTVDFLLSERRDVAAAKRFFSKAMKKHGTPRVITLDAYAASHRAITELQSTGTLVRCVEIRSSKYLNNLIEQDHRRIKQRVRAVLGFKRLETAAITMTGIEPQRRFGNSSSRSGIYQVDLYLFLAYGLLFSRHNPAKTLLNAIFHSF
jgi:transposase-like protein